VTPPGQAVFLVGGLGTRLGALTRTTPKPLIAVGGRPFLMWLAEEVARQGVHELLFLSGYLSAQVEAVAETLATQGLRTRVSVESAPLGTGGALVHAREHLQETFFLLNGDSLFRIALADLAADEGDGPPLARLALRHEPDAGRYGSVELEGRRVVGFREKTGATGLINGGVYWMQRAALASAPPGAFSLERELFPPLAAKGRLDGRVFDAPFIDIGLPSTLAQAQTYVPTVLAGSVHRQDDM
jgi:NDP-sugar pyrophosphorylase family protein